VKVSNQRVRSGNNIINGVLIQTVVNNSLASEFLKGGDLIIYSELIETYGISTVDEPSNDIQNIGNEEKKSEISRKIKKDYISFNDLSLYLKSGFSMNDLGQMLSNMEEFTPFYMIVLREGRFIFYTIDYD